MRQELVLGRRAEAIALLDAGKLRATVIAALLFDSDFDAIRSEPRFAQMLDEVGAGEAHRRAQVWRAAHPLERPIK